MTPRAVTVFGASGFIGRYVVRALVPTRAEIRATVRRPERATFLKPMGEVGQIVPIQANIRDERSVAAAIAGADVVINLVGVLYEGGRQRFHELHTEGAQRVARAAAAAGTARVIHVSALGASLASPSAYAFTKAAGERAVAEAFPQATIVRPSVVFGPEDGFFNRLAMIARLSPVLPLIGGGRTRFQPVYACDVAEAIARMIARDGTAGQTFELGGPGIYSFRAIWQLICDQIDRRRLLVPVPFWAASIEAAFLGLLPTPPLTRDQVRLLRTDNVVSEGALGLAALGIEPTACEVILPTYLDRYRRHRRTVPGPIER
jgi:uncharacterized protein YbjT (DUF2867 family)